jgi:hypothetical protein
VAPKPASSGSKAYFNFTGERQRLAPLAFAPGLPAAPVPPAHHRPPRHATCRLPLPAGPLLRAPDAALRGAPPGFPPWPPAAARPSLHRGPRHTAPGKSAASGPSPRSGPAAQQASDEEPRSIPLPPPWTPDPAAGRQGHDLDV